MASAVLGIDTSGSWCSAALLRGSDVFARRAEVGNAHSDFLLGMIEAVLADAGVALVDCDAIAFSAGPGSFTGLRIACAAAQGLAFGAALKVAPIDTLEAIALSVEVGEETTILVAQDARMGEVYWSLMTRDDSRVSTIAGPALDSPAALRRTLHADHGDREIAIGCGNAWLVHGGAMEGLVGHVVERRSADAVDVARLGLRALCAGRLVAAELAAPVYVRNDIARTTIEREALARAAHAQAIES